jgi:methylamine dehydrogenase heavy chain
MYPSMPEQRTVESPPSVTGRCRGQRTAARTLPPDTAGTAPRNAVPPAAPGAGTAPRDAAADATGRPARTSATVLATALAALVAVAAATPSAAELAPEKAGRYFVLPEKPGPQWFWASDILLHRTALFDAADGRLLGTISAGTAGSGFVIQPLFSPDGREIYIAETYHSRGVRGERTDVVTVYDARTLKPKAEIPIPPKRGEYFPGNAANALSDDGRFLAVFNITPATSLSIVDVRERRLTAEVETAGCSLVFAAGPRRFFMLCANGGALVVELDDAGQAASVTRTDPFFDVKDDPLTEKAVRFGDQWLFTSYEGVIHPVGVGGEGLSFGETWPLFDDTDRAASWRIGGLQHLAVHAPTGRLYALVHQGPRDTHKDPGTEVWVYDIKERARLRRIEAMNPTVSFLAEQAGIGRESLTDRALRALLGTLLPNPGVERILVTQDDDPALIVSAGFPPTITVQDATTGDVRLEVKEPGLGFSLFFTP